MPKIALLGCGGFIGSHFLDSFLQNPKWKIEGWDWDSQKIARHLNHPHFTFHQGDVYADPFLENRLASADVVIALTAMCNPSQYNTEGIAVIESNFIQPRKIAELCAHHKKWLIQFSTSEVYGQTLSHWIDGTNPTQKILSRNLSHNGSNNFSDNISPTWAYELHEDTSPLLMGPTTSLRWSYACAKQLLERYILALHEERGLRYTIIRPFNFLGTRMDYLPGIESEGVPRVLACFTASILEKQPLKLVDGGKSQRTFLAVEEAIEALRLMLEKPEQAMNQIFNLGHPENEIDIAGLAKKMCQLARDLSGENQYLELPLEYVTAEEFYGPGYADSNRRMPNIHKAQTRLGWNPKKNLDQILRSILSDAFINHSNLSVQNAQ